MWHNAFPAEQTGANRVIFYEDLHTDAPEMCRPYCCYIRTVIFHELPLRVVDGQYAQHDSVETAWDLLGQRWTDQDLGWGALAPLVEHQGQIYELIGGSVTWLNGRWVQRWIARRVPDDDIKIQELKRLGWYPFQPKEQACGGS